MPIDHPGVVVSLANRHDLTERIARVLDQEGLLQALLMPLDLTGVRNRLAGFLPATSFPVRRVSQWSHSPAAHSTARAAEMAVAAAWRIIFRGRRTGHLSATLRWRRRALDHSVARRLSRLRPTAILALDGCCRATLVEAARLKVPSVLLVRTDVWGVNSCLASEARLVASQAERKKLLAERWLDEEERIGEDLAAASHVLVESEQIRERVLATGKPAESITVIGQGVDAARYQPSARDFGRKALRVVLVGRVGYAKGVHHAAEAALLAGEAVERLVVVGSDAADGSLLRKRYPNVEFTGLLSSPRLVEQLAFADVFLLPTLADSMARSVLEAMAAGLPVITTRESGYEGLMRQGEEGFFVPAGNPAAIAARLRQLAADGDLRRRMGSAARALAEQHSWERFEDRFRAELDRNLAFLRSPS